MKKLILQITLILLLSINFSYSVTRVDGPSDPEVAKKKFFENRKLDIISMMVAPLIISILWIINKNIFGVYPLGLEPFYPGIFTSMSICAYKWLKK